MELFILKLAVAAIPMITLVAAVNIIPDLLPSHTHHPLSWHRRRRAIQRSLAVGVMLR